VAKFGVQYPQCGYAEHFRLTDAAQAATLRAVRFLLKPGKPNAARSVPKREIAVGSGLAGYVRQISDSASGAKGQDPGNGCRAVTIRRIAVLPQPMLKIDF
jgi:hypothetical protein